MQYESEYYGVTELGDSLMHHGVKGQKHGTRRWQYEDGSLTPAGRIHYGVGEARNKARTDEDAKLQRRKEIVDRALHRPDRLPDKGYGMEYARRKFKKMWNYEDPYVAARRQQLREEKEAKKTAEEKEPAKFSDLMIDQLRRSPSLSSIRLAAEGIKKDAQKVKDVFSSKKEPDALGKLSNDIMDRTLKGDLVPIKKGKIDEVINKYGTEEEKRTLAKEPDADGDNHVSMNFWNGEMTVNGKKMLSRDGDQRTLDPRQQKGEISNDHDLSKLTAKDRRNLSWLVDRDFYEDAASGLDIGSKKYWDAVDNEARELGYKSYRDAAAVYNKLRDLKEKGHNPDGSLTDGNMKKLIKSVINHPGVSLDLDKFADTEKKQAFVKAKEAVDKQHENVRKIEDDFYNNTKLADKYITKSAEKRWNSMSVFEQNNFPGGKAGYINWHLKDDGDQGNGFELYYQEKHYKSSDKKAYDTYNKALNAYAKELTGRNANRTAVGKDMFGKKTNGTRTYEDIVKTSLQFAKTSVQRNAESRAKALKASGKTNAEIADLLGISTFTVYEYLH